MRYAVISDVHGNFPALRAVLEDAERAGAERYLFAGDLFTDLPYTRQILETVRSLPGAVFVSGNREWYMGHLDPAERRREQAAALFLTEEELGEEGLAWVQALPRSVRLQTPDGKGTLLMEHICEEVNGKPPAGAGQKRADANSLYDAFPDRDVSREETNGFARELLKGDPLLRELKARAGADVVIHGHTHVQYAVELDGVLYLNPGSCGLPLDHQAGAPYTLLSYEDGKFSAEERRVSYDREDAIRELRASRFYREAAGWCELNIWQLRTCRDQNRRFFRLLSEEQKKSQPKTDAEHNAVLHRALQLAKKGSF